VSDQQKVNAISSAEEHRLLAELLTQQHTRYNDFCQMCLTANTLLLGFMGLVSTYRGQVNHGLVLLLAFAGVGICVIWMLTLSRLRLDVGRIFWQLRDREAELGLEQGIFRQGFRYMYEHKSLESQKLPEGEGRVLAFPKRRLQARFPAHLTGDVFALLFIAAYVSLYLLLRFVE
jgi:hypothetical protein